MNEFRVAGTQAYSIRTHISLVHEIVKYEEFGYQCRLCEKRFKRMESLKRHIESIHQNTKFPCNHCDYKATEKRSLKKHILKKHTKDQPVSKLYCEICSNQFTNRSTLKLHMQSVHELKNHTDSNEFKS